MAKNILNRFVGATVVGTVIMALPGCTDTWDDHYEGGNVDAPVSETLWDIISSRDDMSRFATIAQKAKYWKDEKHEIKDHSYADVLKGGQLNTVWLPTNDYFTESEFNKWLDLCETDGYTVQEQFMANHISMFRHNVTDNKIDTIRMINGKNMVFDKSTADKTFQGVKVSEFNIPSLNGTLHTIEGVAPFHYNFYEHIKFGNSLPKLREFFVSRDTTYFSESASIEGIPDENGNPTYVDSVYFTSNRLFWSSFLPNTGSEKWEIAEKGVRASLNQEDSAFVMLMPTDAAWNAAIEKLKPYYKYAAKYEDKDKGNMGSKEYRTIDDPDSLTNMSLTQDMVAPTVFNVNLQPKIGGEGGEKWTLDQFVETLGGPAEYLLNTRSDTLRNVGENGEVWNKTSLFNGTPIKMSNGYGYEINEWSFPIQYYKPDVEINIDGGQFYYTSSTQYFKAGNSSRSKGFNNDTYSEITDRYGKVYNNDFYYLESYNGGNPKIEVRLVGNCKHAYVPNAEVMSGKYDIQIVMVPAWYRYIADAGTVDSLYLDQHYVDSISALNKNMFKVQVRRCDGKSTGADITSPSKAKAIVWDNSNKVDTLTVLEDFEFPYSYKNMRYTYPTLIIEGNNSTSNAKKGYTYNLCIDKIILKSKEDGTQIEVDPAN